MSRIIRKQDLNAIEAIIRGDLERTVASSQLESDTLSLEATFLEPMIWQVMIPMLISVTSTFITEKLQKQIRKKRKREDIVAFFVGLEMKENPSVNELYPRELQDLLGPLGFQEKDVESFCDKIRAHLKP